MNSCNIAFVTTLSDDFLPGAVAAIKSLIKNTPTFSYPIIILEWGGLSDYNKSLLKKIYKNISFKHVDYNNYPEYQSGENRVWNYNFNYRYDIFLLDKFDRIIFFDSDIIFNIDISKLAKIKCNFGAVPRSRGTNVQIGKRPGFNAGLMIIGKKFLNKETRDSLIKLSKQPAILDIRVKKQLWIGNEPILNNFFKTFTKLPKKYNLCIDDIKPKINLLDYNIHYIGKRKPWNNSIDSYATNKLASKYGQFFAVLTSKKLVNLYKKYT